MTEHRHDVSPWRHDHVFDRGNPQGERRTRWVLALTVLTMLGEVLAGWWTGSMALLADGWHMGTHALALGAAVLAYALSRRQASDTRYAFGAWKIEVLASFGSAFALGLVALLIGAESIGRLWRPQLMAAQLALEVAVLGLVVNLLSAWLLHGAQHGGDGEPGHHHAHEDHPHHHGHHAHHHDVNEGADLNLRAAYVHVLADALTSVLAIAALFGALWWGWWWLDPLVGLLGAVVISVWAWGLMRQSAAVLLDREMDHPVVDQVRSALESDGDATVADLHVWRVGREQFAVAVCLVADAPRAPNDYRERLASLHAIAHATIEVNRCPGAAGGG